ncbi:hypothetical protein HOLleu_22108 [Holothuria leucospilota]|uniref:Uncharacterized protein n=1 Tax=Holothuria leucospilota TaxID=206669 RepID=A0A9Q1BYY8_HOLLE|nr:hypothetical protein HOLleu_22108 [Holothuria leucospilota]
MGKILYKHGKDWKEQFELYLIASHKVTKSDVVKVGILKYSMGPEWIKVANKFTYAAAGDDKKLHKVIQKFDKYFEPKKLVQPYVTRFNKRDQLPSKTLSDYITAIRELASHCEFGALEESQICIRLSNGVRDEKLKEKLWEDGLS